MSQTQCTTQRELFEVDRKQVTVDFEGGQVVTDAGLLPIRQLDQELGILAEAARRLPDPRSQDQITFPIEQLLAQRVYQILAGYPDGNDANLLRDDPLFKTLVGQSPGEEDQPLASGSTARYSSSGGQHSWNGFADSTSFWWMCSSARDVRCPSGS